MNLFQNDFLLNLEPLDLDKDEEERKKERKLRVKTRDPKLLKKKEKKAKGGYRPVLVDSACLEKESKSLHSSMQLLLKLHADKELSDQDAVAFYIISYLNERYPNQFLENFNPIATSDQRSPLTKTSLDYTGLISLQNKNFESKLEKFKFRSLFDIVNNFNLHSIPYSARFTLVNWYLLNHFKLVLKIDSIPSSEKVLEMQANGERVVSLMTQNINELVMGERDALSFLLHDLVHAYKMFSCEILRKGQIGFSRAMMKILKDKMGRQLIDDLVQNDPKFSDAFDYLISDMNSHPKHLFYYFKAILVEGFKFKYKMSDSVLDGQPLQNFIDTFDVFLEILEMNDAAKKIARKMLMLCSEDYQKGLNGVDFTPLDDYFMNLYQQ